MKNNYIISVNSLQKAYGDKQIFHGFSTNIKRGDKIALMGASGSGKTTFIRMLLGLEKPDDGSIDIAQGTRFCCVFQEDRLCEQLSCTDNIALVLPKTQWGNIAAALKAVGLGHAEINKPAENLSGGEKRRAALVRAVMAQGDILVLDEAFKGLDDDNRIKAYSYINNNLAGRTLLLVTHSKSEAEALGTQLLTIDN